MSPQTTLRPETFNRLAQRTLFAFIVTFIIARAVVFLIMSHRMPNLFFYLQGTHVHHLNYGIFLLAAVAGYSIFARPGGRPAEIVALLYGLALALTFDEFGMWLHLGGSYWQRASVDAVIVVTGVIGLIAYAPTLKNFERHHFWGVLVLVIVLIGFGTTLGWASGPLSEVVGPKLRELELSSTP